MTNKQSGFTLIELLIAIVIVGIFLAVALPSYQSSIRKSRRADGRALLQAAQLAQEKYRQSNATYGVTSNFTGDASFARVCVINGANCLSQSGYYTLTGTATSDGSGYTLTATPSGDQAKDTTCSPLTVTLSATGVTYGPTGCWSS